MSRHGCAFLGYIRKRRRRYGTFLLKPVRTTMNTVNANNNNIGKTTSSEHRVKEGYEAEVVLPVLKDMETITTPASDSDELYTIYSLKEADVGVETPKHYKEAICDTNWVVVCQYRVWPHNDDQHALAHWKLTCLQYPQYKTHLLQYDSDTRVYRIAATAHSNKAKVWNKVLNRTIVKVSPGSVRPLTMIRPDVIGEEESEE